MAGDARRDDDVGEGPVGRLDVEATSNDGTLVADGVTWRVSRAGGDARAEAHGAVPQTAHWTSVRRTLWTLSLDGQTYTLAPRRWYGAGWTLRDAAGGVAGIVEKDTRDGRTPQATFTDPLSNAAKLFVCYLVLTIRRGARRSAGRAGGTIAGTTG
jgi:hypothetical protein